MKLSHKTGILFLCLCMMPYFTGCAAVQVRDRAYLQAMELKDPEQPTVELHDFETTGILSEGSGGTLEQALANASIPTGKELFLGHLELIAYDDPAFGKSLNTWLEDYRLSPSCKVVGLSAGETLAETDTAQLVERLRRAEKSGAIPETDLFTILRELAGTSGTTLLPIVTENGFSAAIITESSSLSTLSATAVAGLCWLRGDNVPQQIALPSQQNYAVTSSATRLSAEVQNGHAVITIFIHLRGEGDFSAAAQIVKSQCDAAIQETVIQYEADVFDLEACLRSQCDVYVAQTDWSTILSQAEFSVQVLNRF